MGHNTEAAPSFVGRRVVWRGPTQRGFLTPAYRRALANGARRPPTPDEQPELHPGDLGIVTGLVTVTGAGHQYAIRFDNGYEVETVIPSGTVALADTPDESKRQQRRYA